MSKKNKRKVIAVLAVIIVIAAIGYMLFVYDSALNFYKKSKINSDATAYIEKNYPDFPLSDVDVSYDKALNYYIAECQSAGDVIILHYAPNLSMELDCYYDDIYTAKAVEYQAKSEEIIANALKDAGLECDAVSVLVDLDASDKDKLVYDGASIENERIECRITYVRPDGEPVMDTDEFAVLVKRVAANVYKEIGETAQIATLKIEYDYDETKMASISWDPRMEDMTIEELAEEIKY